MGLNVTKCTGNWMEGFYHGTPVPDRSDGSGPYHEPCSRKDSVSYWGLGCCGSWWRWRPVWWVSPSQSGWLRWRFTRRLGPRRFIFGRVRRIGKVKIKNTVALQESDLSVRGHEVFGEMRSDRGENIGARYWSGWTKQWSFSRRRRN